MGGRQSLAEGSGRGTRSDLGAGGVREGSDEADVAGFFYNGILPGSTRTGLGKGSEAWLFGWMELWSVHKNKNKSKGSSREFG